VCSLLAYVVEVICKCLFYMPFARVAGEKNE
jgi:hypothetical protein